MEDRSCPDAAMKWDRHRILLVEDDAEISEMLTNYLTTENYEVTCAFDGQEACGQFDASSFSLVLLDLMIPKISGMDVMQHISRAESGKCHGAGQSVFHSGKAGVRRYGYGIVTD